MEPTAPGTSAIRPRAASTPAVPVVMLPTLIVALTVTVPPPLRVTVLSPVVEKVCAVAPTKSMSPMRVHAPPGGLASAATATSALLFAVWPSGPVAVIVGM